MPKRKAHRLVCFFFLLWGDGEIRTHLNAMLRWSIACRRLDGGNTNIFFCLAKENANRIHHPPPNQNPVLTDWVFWFGTGIWRVASNPFKSGADEHRRRGLDRAAPLFFAIAKENANRIRPLALAKTLIPAIIKKGDALCLN